MNRTRLLAVSGMAAIGIVMTPGATTAGASTPPIPHHGGTGTIKVTVIHDYGADHAKGRRICALAMTKHKDEILGKCDTANAQGVAVLKRVPAGTCNIGAFEGHASPYVRAKHKIHVVAGKTTAYTWHFNEVAVS